MASTSFSAITSLVTGAPLSINFGLASDDTCVVYGPGGGPLDLSRLMIRVSNNIADIGSAGSGIRVYVSASSSYSSYGQGDYRINVASNGSAIIGGVDFESARFLNVSGQCVIFKIGSSSSATTAMCTFEAYQLPFGFTG